MTHISEDKLMMYALEIIDDDKDLADIEGHLADCPDCRNRLEKIRHDIDIIGDVKPYRQVIQMPVPAVRRINIYSILKMVALFIFGIFVGYGASHISEKKPGPVSPAYIELSPPDNSMQGYAVCDSTGISERYYEHIHEGQK